MKVNIRLATMNDISALCELYYEFHEFHVRVLPDRLRSLGRLESQDWTSLHLALQNIIDGNESALWVADAEDRLIGLGEVYLRQDDAANPQIVAYPYGCLQSLFVLAPYRRSGVGRWLVEAAQSWAWEKGAAEMRLEIWEFVDGPLEFYEKTGYRTLKRTLVKEF